MSESLLMAVIESTQQLLEVESAGLLRKMIDFLNYCEEVDFAHLEDDGIDLGLLSTSLGLESRVLEDVENVDDVGVGSDGFHGQSFTFEDLPALKHFYDDLLLLFFKILSNEDLSL